MCLIAFAFDAHPRWRLVVAANRDEYYHRPTQPAGWWSDSVSRERWYAGRDLLAGGTWLGLSRGGRFAALTNFRDGQATPGARSRGELPSGFLAAETTPMAWLDRLASDGQAYGGFNLLVATLQAEPTMAWYGNRDPSSPHRLDPGVYALSNHLLETPWPKTLRLKQQLLDALADTTMDDLERTLLAALADTEPASDDSLPDTGIGITWERVLSSAFIRSADYGTRCSTVLAVDRNGVASVIERTWPRPDEAAGTLRERRTTFVTTPVAS